MFATAPYERLSILQDESFPGVDFNYLMQLNRKHILVNNCNSKQKFSDAKQ